MELAERQTPAPVQEEDSFSRKRRQQDSEDDRRVRHFEQKAERGEPIAAEQSTTHTGNGTRPASPPKTELPQNGSEQAQKTARGASHPLHSGPSPSPSKRAPASPKVPANGKTEQKATGKRVHAKPQVPHHRLSFGEELEEEAAQPSSDFSLAQSTALRFEMERELRLPTGNEMPSAFAPPTRDSKTLGPIVFGVAQARGPRPYMEDRYTIVSSFTPLSFTSQPLPDDVMRSFAAVYDGHNGCKAADHACARLHMVLAQQPALRMCTGEAAPAWAVGDGGRREAKEAADMGTAVKHAFQVVDGEILERARAEQGRDGATALVVLRIGEVLWAAHAGDSRAVLSRGGQAIRLTQDHKPELQVEKARVEAAGGRVDFQRCWRVICPARDGRPASGLAVSRSFGDLDFKEPARFIECEPDVTRLRATSEDSFVVMASDGLWDVISDQEAVVIIQEELEGSAAQGSSRGALESRAKDAAEKLLGIAVTKGSMDNITVLLLLLQWH